MSAQSSNRLFSKMDVTYFYTELSKKMTTKKDMSPTCRLLKTVTYLVQQTFIIYQFVNSVTLGRAYFFCLNRACTVILKFLRGTQQYPPIYILSHTYLCSTFSDREYAKASQSDVQKVTCLSITQYDVIINFVVTIAFHRQF